MDWGVSQWYITGIETTCERLGGCGGDESHQSEEEWHTKSNYLWMQVFSLEAEDECRETCPSCLPGT